MKPDIQNLCFSNKQLEGNKTLHSYNNNDGVQHIKPQNTTVLKTLDTMIIDKNENGIKKRDIEKENIDLADDQHGYFRVGDAVDCIDQKYGAWFEATIKKIFYRDEKPIYIVKWDLLEYAQSFETSEKSIRPRAWNIIPWSNLKVGQRVMINHNLDNPSEIGHWYDFEIDDIIRKKNKYTLTGKLYIGNNGESIDDHRIILKDKVYAIEKPELFKYKNQNNQMCLIRRTVAPECFQCLDKSDIICKECGCKICGGKNNPQKIILCDECENEYHIDCLEPRLLRVPQNDWFCPKCKDEENAVTKVGIKVNNRSNKRTVRDHKIKKVCKKKISCITGKNRIMVHKNHRGPIPGIEVGSCWWSRIQVSRAGVHIPPVAGIHGRENDCAYSIVLSGGYGDIDNGNEFIYTGSGGRNISSIAKQTGHQTLTRANKALALNCKAKFNDKEGATALDWRAGIPVRVIRNHKLSKFSKYAPSEGNRYDGLYKVVKYYPEYNDDGFRLWRYVLRRDDPLPPPWTPEGKKMIVELGIQIQFPEGCKTKSSKSSNKKRVKKNLNTKQNKKQKVEPYHLDSNVSELIEKDAINSKLWQEGKSYLSSGKITFLKQISKSLQCSCCQELVFKPVTTPCAHNICQSCLKNRFSAGINSCPTCKFTLQKNVKVSVNKNLAMILILLFPGYERGRK